MACVTLGEDAPYICDEELIDMKKGIHPEYKDCTVRCTCGNTFQTRSTVDSINADICSNCHPFFTGTQKLIDTGGRVDKFKRRMEKNRR